jgi:hypothetical protein
VIDVRSIKHLRRKLHYDSWKQVWSECEALKEAADRHGEFQARAEDWPPQGHGVAYLGNMNLAQTLEHLARWVDASLTGAKFKPPPLPIRLVARAMRHRMMNNPLPLGFKLPPDAELLYIPAPDTDVVESLAHYEAGIAHLATTPQRAPSIVFGPLSAAEWDKSHWRHAELHLGYLHNLG